MEAIWDQGPPLMNAAGTVKTVEQVKDLLQTPLTVVVAGSYTLAERPGNPGSTYFATALGSVNSLGLPSPDVETWSRWISEASSLAADAGKSVCVSVAGFSPLEYRELVDRACSAGAQAVEVNLGCPNIWDGGSQKPITSYSPATMSEVLSELSSLGPMSIPIGLKLSPIFDLVLMDLIDEHIRSAPWVSFVTTCNTIPNCFALDEKGQPGISEGSFLGGMSGPAIKWIGQGQVLLHRDRLPSIPILGVGGISSGSDLAEYLSPRVGATACQIGTAIWQRGPRSINEILHEFVAIAQV